MTTFTLIQTVLYPCLSKWHVSYGGIAEKMREGPLVEFFQNESLKQYLLVVLSKFGGLEADTGLLSSETA